MRRVIAAGSNDRLGLVRHVDIISALLGLELQIQLWGIDDDNPGYGVKPWAAGTTR